MNHTMKDSEPYRKYIYRYKMQYSVSSPLLNEQPFRMTGQWACFFLSFLYLSPRRCCFSRDSGGFFLSFYELNRLNDIAWNH